VQSRRGEGVFRQFLGHNKFLEEEEVPEFANYMLVLKEQFTTKTNDYVEPVRECLAVLTSVYCITFPEAGKIYLKSESSFHNSGTCGIGPSRPKGRDQKVYLRGGQ